MPLVLDASITMAWCFVDEATPFVKSVFRLVRDRGAVVPTIWPLEIANTLPIGERRQRITEAATTRFIQTLQALPIAVDERASSAAWEMVLALGRAQGLSAYDAAYLELAMRQGLPLATNDTRLSEAASRVGVPLLH